MTAERDRRVDRDALILYMSAAVTLGFLDHRVRRFSQHVVTEFIPSVLAGTSGAPAKYRVLMPLTLDRLTRWTGADPYLVFLVVEVVTIFAALVALHRYLRFWYAPGTAIAGVLAAAALIPLTFTNSWAHPDTFPDLCLFSLGCLFVASRRDLWLAIVLLIGMFNRETTGLLVLLWGLDRLLTSSVRQYVARGAGLAMIAAAAYLSVRWVRGFETYRLFMLPENLAILKILPAGFDPYTRVAGYFWLVIFGPAAVFAFKGAWRPDAPPFFRAGLITAGCFSVVAWLFAAIIELRVLTPLVPLLLPGALHRFADFKIGAREPRSA
jgi:hypothetical protein